MKYHSFLHTIELTATNRFSDKLDYSRIPVSASIKRIDNESNPYKHIAYFTYRNGNGSFSIKHTTNNPIPPPIVLRFDANYGKTIGYDDVKRITDHLETSYGYKFRVSNIHLATDISSKKHIGLFKKIRNTFRIEQQKSYRPTDTYKTGFQFGTKDSRVTVVVYDKTVQMLDEKGIDIGRDVTRVEARFFLCRKNNFIRTLDELADHDWSWVYGKVFKFQIRTAKLNRELHRLGENRHQPLWDLRDIMIEQGKTSSNFFKCYLKDHPKAEMVRDSLANFKWRQK